MQDCTREKLNAVIDDPSANTFMQKYLEYEKMVRNGHLGKTVIYWLIVRPFKTDLDASVLCQDEESPFLPQM